MAAFISFSYPIAPKEELKTVRFISIIIIEDENQRRFIYVNSYSFLFPCG